MIWGRLHASEVNYGDGKLPLLNLPLNMLHFKLAGKPTSEFAFTLEYSFANQDHLAASQFAESLTSDDLAALNVTNSLGI